MRKRTRKRTRNTARTRSANYNITTDLERDEVVVVVEAAIGVVMIELVEVLGWWRLGGGERWSKRRVW